MVGGTRLWVSVEQIPVHLAHFFQVETDMVWVARYSFLILFNNIAMANCILHIEPPPRGGEGGAHNGVSPLALAGRCSRRAIVLQSVAGSGEYASARIVAGVHPSHRRVILPDLGHVAGHH
jgi:hypothetical protein